MSILLDAVHRQQQEQSTTASQTLLATKSDQFRHKRLSMLLFVLGTVVGSGITALYLQADATPATVATVTPTANAKPMQVASQTPQQVALPLPEAQPWENDAELSNDWATDSAQPEPKPAAKPKPKSIRVMPETTKVQTAAELENIESEPLPEQDVAEQSIEPETAMTPETQAKGNDKPDAAQLKAMQQDWLEQKVLQAAQEVLKEAKQQPKSTKAIQPEPKLNLSVSVHQYSPSAKNRFLLIDGNFVHEGDMLANGAKLLQIRANDAIFEYKGKNVTLNLVDD